MQNKSGSIRVSYVDLFWWLNWTIKHCYIILQLCSDKQQFTVVGRSIDDQCKECCAHDGCNKELCLIEYVSGINLFCLYYFP